MLNWINKFLPIALSLFFQSVKFKYLRSMQTHPLNDIKKSLLTMEPHELTALCLRLAKYKKENKELLAYLLFESKDEAQYIENLKLEIDAFFDELKFFGAYHYTKQIRKILRLVAKHIKYSATPATEVELLVHFCQRLQKLIVGKHPITALENIYARQVDKIEKSMGKLHEDIQFYFAKDLEALKASIDE